MDSGKIIPEHYAGPQKRSTVDHVILDLHEEELERTPGDVKLDLKLLWRGDTELLIQPLPFTCCLTILSRHGPAVKEERRQR